MENSKHYADGFKMGQADREEGVTRPTYFIDKAGALVCWEAIYARLVKSEDEKQMAQGYIASYAKGSASKGN